MADVSDFFNRVTARSPGLSLLSKYSHFELVNDLAHRSLFSKIFCVLRKRNERYHLFASSEEAMKKICNCESSLSIIDGRIGPNSIRQSQSKCIHLYIYIYIFTFLVEFGLPYTLFIRRKTGNIDDEVIHRDRVFHRRRCGYDILGTQSPGKHTHARAPRGRETERELMPLANDDASAVARGRHVVSVDVATRSSTYVADQRYSSPAGHPRATEITPSSSATSSSSSTSSYSLPPLLTPTRHAVTYTPRRLLLPRDLSHPFSRPIPPSVAARRPENQAGASTPLLLLHDPRRYRYAFRHSLGRNLLAHGHTEHFEILRLTMCRLTFVRLLFVYGTQCTRGFTQCRRRRSHSTHFRPDVYFTRGDARSVYKHLRRSTLYVTYYSQRRGQRERRNIIRARCAAARCVSQSDEHTRHEREESENSSTKLHESARVTEPRSG